MKRWIVPALLWIVVGAAWAELPASGPLSLKQISTEFDDPGTGGSGNYTSALTYGDATVSTVLFTGYSTSVGGGFGSFAGGTPTTDDGKTITGLYVFCTLSGGTCASNNWSYRLVVSGFGANPNSRYVHSVYMDSYNGNSLTYNVTNDVSSGSCGTQCSYGYSSGVAEWTWGAYAAPQPYEHTPSWFSQPYSIVITGTSGSGGYTVPSKAVWLYRSGGYVPNIACNAGVPTSGPIKFSDFYGACRQ